jgi:hypothetical protein
MQTHLLIGLFALLTIVLAGAAIGRFIGLSAFEGAYLTLFTLGVVSSVLERLSRRRAQQP